ncbi:CLUMA_CG002431, isoform A [Clunio marinus]|uniref:CLUMA_CG002431, isoform A n=1 Tax=Clunio marinus TaxID=568069 RepID=A0A1J1HKT1_9DIPT|nr:CLUMA_CG002431, isoform A [Clunio marinus]
MSFETANRKPQVVAFGVINATRFDNRKDQPAINNILHYSQYCSQHNQIATVLLEPFTIKQLSRSKVN